MILKNYLSQARISFCIITAESNFGVETCGTIRFAENNVSLLIFMSGQGTIYCLFLHKLFNQV
jgi:hypothetical protein